MLLSEFYKNMVHRNDTRTGGWGSLYYGIFSDIIKQHKYNIVAEVGIGYGTHAKSILQDTLVQSYT